MGDETEAARILGQRGDRDLPPRQHPGGDRRARGDPKGDGVLDPLRRRGRTGEGSARIQHQYKVDPNKVRGLPPGAAYVISRGRAMSVAGAPGARRCAAQLPEPRQSPEPRERGGRPASVRDFRDVRLGVGEGDRASRSEPQGDAHARTL